MVVEMKKYKKKKKIDYDKITNKRFGLFLGIVLLAFLVVFWKMLDVMVINKDTFSKKLASLT